ncbi:hypothetical protein [uncultured Cohaesibacter sp.]|uniref:hypothetical protein n=1 Tax=uncultured Cohaesibacter sp. TaxID=1002546 RepID=UPI0029C69B44|nr:hypothetical protein [uncultured Cohaesibacter sp.]
MTDLILDPSKKPRRKAGVPFVDHWCQVVGCNKWGSFGIGRDLWFCSDHLEAARARFVRRPVSSDAPEPKEQKQAQGRLI